MKPLFESWEEIADSVERPVAAIGKFDALHLGHRVLVVAAAGMGTPVLLTFSGMAQVLGWPPRLPVVAAVDRTRVLNLWRQELGCAVHLVKLPFAKIRELSPPAFVRLLREELGVIGMVTGPNFRFGKDRAGDVARLHSLGPEQGLRVVTVEPVRHGGKLVSSSRVRRLLVEGDVATVAQLLDRPHRLIGRVVRAAVRGPKTDSPAASCGERLNLEPGPGVYAAWASVDRGRPLPAVVNIERQPTVGDHEVATVEAHILEGHGDCSDAQLALDFVSRVRDEKHFSNVDTHKAQITRDVAEARRVLLGE